MFFTSKRAGGERVSVRQQMKLNSKISWTAAWAGLAIVVLVPSADFLTGGQQAPSALITSDIDPVVTADTSPAPVVTPAATTAPRVVLPAPVGTTSVPTVKAVAPVPTVTASAPAADPEPEVETASLGPSATSPPFPAPRPSWLSTSPVVETPAAPAVASTAPVVVVPRAASAAPEQPLIIDESELADRVAATDPDRPVPPAGIANDPQRETLSEYLARRGLLDDGRSSATVVYSNTSESYDPDGFYFDDGPNNDSSNMTPQQWRRWLLARGIDPDDLEPF
jgi:hypothetical protein